MTSEPSYFSGYPNDQRTSEISSLAELASPDCELTREETKKVLNQVKLFILADDDLLVRRAIFRIIAGRRRNIAKLEGDMTKCFDSLSTLENGQVPIILCDEGSKAKEAVQIVNNRQIDGGLFIFDHYMGPPHGLEIFKDINGSLPPRNTRVLLSGTLPDDCDECLEAGILDLATKKPPENWNEFRTALAQAYLRRMHI